MQVVIQDVDSSLKHEVGAARFDYQLREEVVSAVALLNGNYAIRTAVPKTQMPAAEVIRSYEALARVELAFRSLKTVDLHVRLIDHRLEGRVRAHIFLCMLGYYVQWHLLEVWPPLLFSDDDQAAKATRDPVAPAQRSEAARENSTRHTQVGGPPVHSLRTLLEELAALVRNSGRAPGAFKQPITFDLLTVPTATQRKGLRIQQRDKAVVRNHTPRIARCLRINRNIFALGARTNDMDSPCPYGIGCARLKVVGRSITEQEESLCRLHGVGSILPSGCSRCTG